MKTTVNPFFRAESAYSRPTFTYAGNPLLTHRGVEVYKAVGSSWDQLSILRNPDIAHVLYLRGLMEKAGRGSVLMVRQCQEQGLPAPVWASDEALGVTVTFDAPKHQASGASGTKSAPSHEQLKILRKCLEEIPITELMKAANRADRTKFRNQVIKPLLDHQWVEMTLPDKPTSSLCGG